MRILVARHGQTQWNALNKVCGRTDLPLTELGHAQARELARKLEHEGIDLIIASPMIRARQTAQAVADLCGVPVLVDERLIEQNFGIFEGVDKTAAVEKIASLLEPLVGKIPGLLWMELNETFQGGMDYVLYSEFESREALIAYAEHPLHLAAKDQFFDMIATRVAGDYEY